jgi:PQQ-dependent dehydrogenase (methanol/ethanol family)
MKSVVSAVRDAALLPPSEVLANIRGRILRAGKPWLYAACGLTLMVAATGGSAAAAAAEMRAANVDEAMIVANARTGKEWPSTNLDYAGTRFSKLTQIDAKNVKTLGLVWTYDLDSIRGVEAPPVVVDGIMYETAPWSIVHAIDARTGKKLWTYDPEVPRGGGYQACCDVVNRGVAVHKGKIYVASLDGRLMGLDAATGKKIWEQDTIIDHGHSYTVTGAPRVFRGKVIIGNGGADLGARGYITAYDAETGEMKWRWFQHLDPFGAAAARRESRCSVRQALGSV